MTDFVNNINKSGMTKAERKAIHDNIIREKKRTIMLDYSEHDKSRGEFVKDFRHYYSYDHVTYERLSMTDQDAIFATFPEEFKKAGINKTFIFNNEYWIAYDDDDFTFTVPHTMDDGHIRHFRPEYNRCETDEERALFDIHIAKGERSNPRIMIFHKDHPEMVRTVKFNIWENLYTEDYIFDMQIRPNRIYVKDLDGIRIYDFELNLLYTKPQSGEHTYYYTIDKVNWNHLWIWNNTEARAINYENLESISELVIT
jgi:hypothetical protein